MISTVAAEKLANGVTVLDVEITDQKDPFDRTMMFEAHCDKCGEFIAQLPHRNDVVSAGAEHTCEEKT